MKNKKDYTEVASPGALISEAEDDLHTFLELAALCFEVPVCAIKFIDDEQHPVSNVLLDDYDKEIIDTCSKLTAEFPGEITLIKDIANDPRFSHLNHTPRLNFFAGIPLLAEQGKVVGTLNILGEESRDLTSKQKKALPLLAKRAMKTMEHRTIIQKQSKFIELKEQRLLKITENIPIGLYELKIDTAGQMKFQFLSKGMERIHPDVDIEEWMKDPNIGFSLMHPDDIAPLKNSLANTIANNEDLYHEYRIKAESGYHWHAMTGTPEKTSNGDTILYGSFTDVTNHYNYEATLEKISFDISHVLRRPVTSMLGITTLIESEHNLSPSRLKEYSNHIQTIAKELEEFTHNLNDLYHLKKEEIIIQNNKFKK